jgi:hypothetical protein
MPMSVIQAHPTPQAQTKAKHIMCIRKRERLYVLLSTTCCFICLCFILKDKQEAFESTKKKTYERQSAVTQEASVLTFSVTTPIHITDIPDNAESGSRLVLSIGGDSFRPSAIFTGRLKLNASMSTRTLQIHAINHETSKNNTFLVQVETVRLIERVLTLKRTSLSIPGENMGSDRACRAAFGSTARSMPWGDNSEYSVTYTKQAPTVQVRCGCVGILRRVCVAYEQTTNGLIVVSTRIHTCERVPLPEVTVGLHVYLMQINHTVEQTAPVYIELQVRSANDPHLALEGDGLGTKWAHTTNRGALYAAILSMTVLCFLLGMYVVLVFIIDFIVSCLLGVSMATE